MNKKAQIAVITSVIAVALVFVALVSAAPKKCNNGIDDDGDGLIDWSADAGCSSKSDNTETNVALVCDNGFDETNDADTLSDFRLIGGDSGCISVTDTSETDGQCDDFIDNDGDSWIDLSDSKCAGFSDLDESPRDFCSDSDGGIVSAVQGNATGQDSSIPFSHTDICLTSVLLQESYCGSLGDDYNPLSVNVTCPTNMTGNITTGGCFAGACVSP